MFDHGSFVFRITREAKRVHTGTGRAGARLAVLAAAGLLAACAAPFPLLTDQAAAHPEPAAATAPVQARTKPHRPTTARDILAEWGTFGLDRQPYRRGRAPAAWRAADAAAIPAYSMPIQEIIANASCRSCDQRPYHSLVVQASNRHGVPVGLIHAVIQKESGYNAAATSRKRARGLMQVTPDTGRFMGVANSRQLYDPRTNINAGTAYLKYLMLSHDTVEEVLAAYNAGPGNVRKYNGVPPFSETRRYVHDVKKLYVSTSGG